MFYLKNLNYKIRFLDKIYKMNLENDIYVVSFVKAKPFQFEFAFKSRLAMLGVCFIPFITLLAYSLLSKPAERKRCSIRMRASEFICLSVKLKFLNIGFLSK